MLYRPTRQHRGRHANRVSAGSQGTLATWTQSLVSQLVSERQRSRVADRALDLYTNDGMAHGLLETILVECVGTGMTPSFDPKAAWIGKDQGWGEDYATRAQQVFEAWGLDFRCWADAQRRLDFYGLQALATFCWKLDGIGVFQVVQRADAMRPLSLALLPIDPFRLVTPSDVKGDVYDGIEVDNDGAPVAAYIRKPGVSTLRATKGDCDRVSVYDPKTGLPRLLLVTGVRNISEYRQDSLLGPIIKEIRDSNDFVDAALVGALVRNLFVLFVQDMSSTKDNTPLSDRVLEMDKGTVIKGAQRELPHFFQHHAAPNGYRELFEGIVDRVGMASGRGAESVLRRYQASYSASRANMERAEQLNDFERTVLDTRFNRPAVSWMLYEAALHGMLPVSPDEFRANLYALTACQFLPQPARHIDREKAANATAIELSTGTTSYERIYGEQGRNWRQALEQRARELAYIKQLEQRHGVQLSPVAPTGTKPTATTNQQDKEETPDEPDAS